MASLPEQQNRQTTYAMLAAAGMGVQDYIARSIVVPSKFLTVLTAYRHALFAELFPRRGRGPKTFIFPYDESDTEGILAV